MKTCVLAALVCLTSTCAFGQGFARVSASEAAPLRQVIKEVERALNEYQNNLVPGDEALPPLLSAEFDFKVTTATKDGFTLNLFIFKIGSSHENDVVNDMTFSYGVPAAPHGLGRPRPVELKDELVRTVASAARAIKEARTLSNLALAKVSVTVSYGVQWNGNVDVNPTFSFVTIDVGRNRTKNTVQSVTLVFGP